ncbi:hypothetical protein ON010_g9983 [Phytophthora cinnamomi]|nr:hypothetical protein ON010_g9983 [Phytophthora cinnamomi]
MILETIGSLRHVASCSPPAHAFLQALQNTACTFPRFGLRILPTQALHDSRWFRAVLDHPQQFNKIPTADFASVTNRRLMALWTLVTKACLSINIRGLRGAVLAAVHWGSYWSASPSEKKRVHVKLHIDNTSALETGATFTDLSNIWEQCCDETPWLALPLPSTVNTGVSGANSQGK